MKKILYILLLFILLNDVTAQQLEFTLKQRRAYDQIIVEIWAKSLSALAPKLGSSFLTLEYDSTFLTPAATQTYNSTDSISNNINQTNPIVDISTKYNSTNYGYGVITFQSFAPNYYSLKINLTTLGQGGLAPDSIGRGSFIGKIAFNIKGSPAAASLTKIKWSKGNEPAAVVINNINGNSIKDITNLKDPGDFTVIGFEIIYPKTDKTIIDKDLNYACLTSYYNGGGFPIYFERSVDPAVYSIPLATSPALDEDLAYRFQYSQDNGANWFELGRVTETDRPSSQIGNNPFYRTGQIFNPFNYAANIITSQNGARITKTNYRNPVRVIWTKDKYFSERSEQMKLKITKLAGVYGVNLTTRADDIYTSIAKGTYILGKSFFLQLNGTNQYLKTNRNFSNSTQLTVEAWVNLNYNYAASAEPGIVASSGGPNASPILGSNEGAWLLYLKDGKYPAFRVREIQARGKNGYLATLVADICDSLKVAGDGTPISNANAKNWTHIAATVENNVACLYVNGELVSRFQNDSSLDIRMLTTAHPIWVGINPNGQITATRYLRAGLKEVKVWRVALTQDEIRSRAVGIQNPANTSTYGDFRRGLELYYSFDGTLNDLASDSTYQNAADNINLYQVNLIKNDTARFRPDLPHIKLTSPSIGVGIQNLQDKTYDIRWISYGLGEPFATGSNDVFIEYSIDSGATWFYARDPNARDHNGNTNIDVETGTAVWEPYQNNNAAANLRTINPFSRSAMLRVKGNSNNNQGTIEDNSGLFSVAPFFAVQRNMENQILYIEPNEGMNLTKNIYFFDAWINPYRFPTKAEGIFPIIYKCDSSSKKLHYGMSLLSTGQIEFDISDANGTIHKAKSDINYPLVLPNSYSDEIIWTHIGVLLILKNESNKPEIRFYIDGRVQRADSLTSQLGDTLAVLSQNKFPTYVGYIPLNSSISPNGNTRSFYGEIRELRLWEGVPGKVSISGEEPTELTYFVQGLQAANASNLDDTTKKNLHTCFSFNGGSFVINGIARAIEKSEKSGSLLRIYGNKVKFVPAIPFIKLVEPEFNQAIASTTKDYRLRWVGFNYYGLGFYSGADSLSNTPPSLEFSIRGGGGVEAQPYQYVGSKYWGAFQVNSLVFPDSTNFRFKNSNPQMIYAAKLDVSKADPDVNNDGRFDDQGLLPASISNARFRINAKYNIFNESKFLKSESQLFTITPLSNFNTRVLLEGYHKGKISGNMLNNLGSTFETGGLKIKLYTDVAGQPDMLLDSAISVFGYDNTNPSNRNNGTNNFANVQYYFPKISNGYYWLVIEHINHLPVMSRFPAPFIFEGDDKNTWYIESGWDFESWNGVSNNVLPTSTANPWTGNFYTAFGNSNGASTEEGFLSTALIYNDGKAGTTLNPMPALIGGDIIRDGTIDEKDGLQARLDNGTTNARSDVTGDGFVNAGDRTIVYRNYGHTSSLLDLGIAPEIFSNQAESSSCHSEPQIKEDLYFNGDDIRKSFIPKQCFQSYYQQADRMTRDKSCYQLADSMTEKRCRSESQRRISQVISNTELEILHSVQNDRQRPKDKKLQLVNYLVFGESSINGDFIELDMYIQNQGPSFALANCTFAVTFNQNVLKYNSFVKKSNIIFEDSTKGYRSVWSAPLDTAKNKLEGVRTIEIDYDNFTNLGGELLTLKKTYIGTLRFSILKRDEIVSFNWHESSDIHSTDDEIITERGVFNLINPLLLYSLSITKPTSSEVLPANEQYSITWTTDGKSSAYIDFSSDNGMLWSRITYSPIRIEDKSYSWTAPNIHSEMCLIKIVDSATLVELDRSKNPFSIMSSFAQIYSPASGDSYYTGGAKDTIRWFTQVYRLIRFEFSSDGGENWSNASGNLNALNQATVWVIPKVTTRNGVLRMLNSETGKEIARTGTFKILNGMLMFRKPIENEIVKAGKSYKIQWVSSSVDEFDLEFSTDDGATWSNLVYNQKASSNYYNWTVPTTEYDYCWLRATWFGDVEMTYDMVGPFSILYDTYVEEFSNDGIEIYPNPANDYINIRLPETSNNFETQFYIFDIYGREIDRFNSVPQNNEIRHILDQKVFSNGVYYLQYSLKNQNFSVPFVIER
ncbi:MAG TPA: T9SS type A sorting domain-containing protein [Candidatus Kapabacteria bacterium]|nr:T9SS type A sorting domain-containing protein [Candidatus Kapabacteria bacterium]